MRLTGRTHHIPMSAATMTGAVPMAHGCTVTSAVHRALCANRAMFRSKVLGRAGRRHGYQRRSCDGRAQPRAVWATPRSAERAPASDGADDREKRQSDLSFPSVFVTAVNATSRERAECGIARARSGARVTLRRTDRPVRPPVPQLSIRTRRSPTACAHLFARGRVSWPRATHHRCVGLRACAPPARRPGCTAPAVRSLIALRREATFSLPSRCRDINY